METKNQRHLKRVNKMEFTTKPIKISLDDLFQHVALIRHNGNTEIRLHGNQIAIFEDFTVVGCGDRKIGYAIEFIPKKKRLRKEDD